MGEEIEVALAHTALHDQCDFVEVPHGHHVRRVIPVDKTRVCWLDGFYGRGTTRAEDDQGIPTQSRTSGSILVYEDCDTVGVGVLGGGFGEWGLGFGNGNR